MWFGLVFWLIYESGFCILNLWSRLVLWLVYALLVSELDFRFRAIGWPSTNRPIVFASWHDMKTGWSCRARPEESAWRAGMTLHGPVAVSCQFSTSMLCRSRARVGICRAARLDIYMLNVISHSSNRYGLQGEARWKYPTSMVIGWSPLKIYSSTQLKYVVNLRLTSSISHFYPVALVPENVNMVLPLMVSMWPRSLTVTSQHDGVRLDRALWAICLYLPLSASTFICPSFSVFGLYSNL